MTHPDTDETFLEKFNAYMNEAYQNKRNKVQIARDSFMNQGYLGRICNGIYTPSQPALAKIAKLGLGLNDEQLAELEVLRKRAVQQKRNSDTREAVS